MINAIGLQGIGVHRFVKEKLPRLREAGARTFVNVCGTTLDEYVANRVAYDQARITGFSRLDATGVVDHAAVEMKESAVYQHGGLSIR